MSTQPPNDEISAELNDPSTVKPHYVVQDPSFPLTLLSDRQFELLAQLLLDAEKSTQNFYDSALLLPYGADEGRDIVLYAGQFPVGVVQCKRYASTIGIDDVLKELFKFLLFALRNPSFMPDPKRFRYEFWTAKDLTKVAGNFFKEPDRYFREHEATLAGHVKAGRACSKKLLEAVPGATEAEEQEQVIAIARTIQFAHVDRTAISRRLLARPTVRSWFFRSPEDVPNTPSVTQLGALIQHRTRLRLHAFAQSGHLSSKPYVRPQEIDEAFGRFLDSGEQMFVLTGGSGHGKTTWAAHLLNAPPKPWQVTLVRGEDLAASDINVAETLGRLLRAERLPEGLTGADMTSAVWRWLDSANSLVVVDGLDRAPAHVRNQIPAWIDNTRLSAASFSIRLVLISRNEMWGTISVQLGNKSHMQSHLGMLSYEAALAMYAAYGLPPVDHFRPLRTPSLIRRLSELNGKLGVSVTRTRLLEISVGERKQELAYRLGKAQVERAFISLSRVLSAAPDVLLHPTDFDDSSTLTVLDELNKQDFLVSVQDALRPESDDVAEYLISLALDCQKALDQVAGGRTDPIFFGAIAMAPQLSGRRNELPGLVAAVLDKTRSARGPWFELAARIMTEVEDHAEFLLALRQIFDLWDHDNFVLLSSNLHELLDDLRLPFADRFDLLMRLAAHEDEDDWRWKFWLDEDARGRIMTPFAVAISKTVRESPADSLLLLKGVFATTCDKSVRAVVTGLLLEVAELALAKTLDCCVGLGETGRELISSLARLYPRDFARYALDAAQTRTSSMDELVDDFCGALHHASASDDAVAARAEFSVIAQKILELGAGGETRLRLLLCCLEGRFEKSEFDELMAALSSLRCTDVWWLAKVAGPHAEKPLRAIFSGKLDEVVPYGTLSRIDPSVIQAEHWPLVAGLLAELIDVGDDVARTAAADAVEMILRRLEDESAEAYSMFMALGRRLASDSVGAARMKLVYYAAARNFSQKRQRSHVRAFRAELVSILVEAEDGTTLHPLRQKLYAREEKDLLADAALARLEQRFGPPSKADKSLYDVLARWRWWDDEDD